MWHVTILTYKIPQFYNRTLATNWYTTKIFLTGKLIQVCYQLHCCTKKDELLSHVSLLQCPTKYKGMILYILIIKQRAKAMNWLGLLCNLLIGCLGINATHLRVTENLLEIPVLFVGIR